MSDYIRKSELIESIKAEIQCVEKEKQQYFESGNFHNGNILVEKIQAMKLVMKIVANQPTLSKTKIIRKVFERVVERLEHQAGEFIDLSHRELCSISIHAIKYLNKGLGVARAIEIVKEECGINELD